MSRESHRAFYFFVSGQDRSIRGDRDAKCQMPWQCTTGVSALYAEHCDAKEWAGKEQ
jgi:hypothetical protein